MDVRKLKPKRRRFIDRYCLHMNGSLAAREAGYSAHCAAQIAYVLLRNADVKAEIDRRLEAMSMTAGEAQRRISDMARATFEPFMQQKENGTAVMDLTTFEAKQNLHLVKKLKQVDTVIASSPDDAGVVIQRKLEVELHDSQSALDKVLKMRGLYKGKEDPDPVSTGVQIIVNGGPTGIERQENAEGGVTITVGA